MGALTTIDSSQATPPAPEAESASPARPRDVLVLVDEARTKAWLRWIRKGEAAKAGVLAMVERDLAREPAATPRTPRGHHAPKIAEASRALMREGKLPDHLRPGERNRRILAKLTATGYGNDLPSRSALGRFFATAAGETVNSVDSVKAEDGEAV